MQKKARRQLDEVDIRILDILRRDGRTSAAKIADEVGLSRPAVASRLDELERSRILRGTTAVIDEAALGRDVTAFISARVVPGHDPVPPSRLRALARRDDVLEIHTVAGDDCYLIKVRTESIAALNALVAKLGSSPFSMSTRTTIVMETHFEKVGGVALEGEGS